MFDYKSVCFIGVSNQHFSPKSEPVVVWWHVSSVLSTLVQGILDNRTFQHLGAPGYFLQNSWHGTCGCSGAWGNRKHSLLPPLELMRWAALELEIQHVAGGPSPSAARVACSIKLEKEICGGKLDRNMCWRDVVNLSIISDLKIEWNVNRAPKHMETHGFTAFRSDSTCNPKCHSIFWGKSGNKDLMTVPSGCYVRMIERCELKPFNNPHVKCLWLLRFRSCQCQLRVAHRLRKIASWWLDTIGIKLCPVKLCESTTQMANQPVIALDWVCCPVETGMRQAWPFNIVTAFGIRFTCQMWSWV
jgi:hypothetical protein